MLTVVGHPVLAAASDPYLAGWTADADRRVVTDNARDVLRVAGRLDPALRALFTSSRRSPRLRHTRRLWSTRCATGSLRPQAHHRELAELRARLQPVDVAGVGSQTRPVRQNGASIVKPSETTAAANRSVCSPSRPSAVATSGAWAKKARFAERSGVVRDR